MPHDHKTRARTGAGALSGALRLALAFGGVFAGLFLTWHVREALVLAFAALVLAVVLDAAASPLERHLHLPRSLALAAIAILAVSALTGLGWLMGTRIQGEVSNLGPLLVEAVRSVEGMLGLRLLPRGEVTPGGATPQGGLQDIVAMVAQVFGTIASVGSAATGLLAAMVIVVVGAFFLAAAPDVYRRGLVLLFPPSRHGPVEDALAVAGRALRRWLLAKLVAMVIVGVLAGLGTWLVGLPAPLALGLFAGLTEFVPMLGPLVGAVPALLLALTQGGTALAWTALLFLAIQQLESNMIEPVVERRMLSLPPALLLFAVLAVGLLFGLPGVVIAAPLTVVLFVLVKTLYVRRILGEEAEVPGEE